MSVVLCPTPMDSSLLGWFKTALAAYSAAQEALLAGTKFYVRKNQLRPYTQKQFPLVNVWSGDPGQPGSVTKKGGEEQAALNLDLFVKIAAETGQHLAGDDQADQVALDRLYYLREQVKRCITNLAVYDLGQVPGSVVLQPAPVWKLFLTEHGFPDETLVAGRLTFTVTYGWAPDNSRTAVPFQQATVNAGAWAGIWT